MSVAPRKSAPHTAATPIGMMHFDRLMETRGWVILESVIGQTLIDRMMADIQHANRICGEVQLKNGVARDTEYTVHQLIGLGQSFLDFLEDIPIKCYIERYFAGTYILNSFGGAIISAHSRSYAHNIHRDIRSFPGTNRRLLDTLVMFDAFTEQNGECIPRTRVRNPMRNLNAEFADTAQRKYAYEFDYLLRECMLQTL